jgi:tol-pal system-associated acyl-CoA thioesterase
VVYHSNYLTFMERARTEFLRHLGVELSVLEREQGVLFAVRSVSVDFKAPARLDDLLEITVDIKELRPASLMFRQSVRCEGRVLCEGDVRVAALSAEHFRPIAMPSQLAALFDQIRRGVDRSLEIHEPEAGV